MSWSRTSLLELIADFNEMDKHYAKFRKRIQEHIASIHYMEELEERKERAAKKSPQTLEDVLT